MKANEFVKKFGWEDAKGLLCRLLELGVSDDMKFTATNNMWHRGADGFTWSELKRFVESHELVEVGLPELKEKMFSDSKNLEDVKNWVLTVNESLLTNKGLELKRAIELVEACQ